MKWIICLLFAVLLTLSLTACNSVKDNSSSLQSSDFINSSSDTVFIESENAESSDKTNTVNTNSEQTNQAQGSQVVNTEDKNREYMKQGILFKTKTLFFAWYDGEPLHPDSVPNYLQKFSKRYGLPHINAHAFRHAMVSMLYFNGVDSVSISKRLGHAQVSTTANIYAHIVEEADKKNADILSEKFLKKA